MLLIQRLCQAQCVFRGEPKTAVGFTLQAREVEKQGRQLCRGLGFLADRPGLAVAFCADCLGFLPAQAVTAELLRLELDGVVSTLPGGRYQRLS